MPTLRLLSLNARVLPANRVEISRLIAAAAPDLAILHGSPSLVRWRSVSAALGRESGLVVVCGGRTSGANLLLSTLGVDVLATRELTMSGARGVRPPGAALAALRLLGSSFDVGAGRLGAPAQAGELRDAVVGLSPDDVPTIIALDTAAGATPASSTAAAGEILGVGRAAVDGGVFVDGRIAVVGVERRSPGLVEIELTLP